MSFPKKRLSAIVLLAVCNMATAGVHEGTGGVNQSVIDAQNAELDHATEGKGYGPQSPRDLTHADGANTHVFGSAPATGQMNLCNIHMHMNAEHKGGDFTKYAGPGDGHGFHTGFQYTGHLDHSEVKPLDHEVCPSEHGGLQAGDTIEVHYVYSTAEVNPGPTLGSCLNENDKNPQLRVDAHVMVLVNDDKAADFKYLTEVGKQGAYNQALHVPNQTGAPIQYQGSTTGPGYNEKASPFQVSWGVHPHVVKVNAESVNQWCKGNVFNEDHAHGVRNLVVNPTLLSHID